MLDAPRRAAGRRSDGAARGTLPAKHFLSTLVPQTVSSGASFECDRCPALGGTRTHPRNRSLNRFTSHKKKRIFCQTQTNKYVSDRCIENKTLDSTGVHTASPRRRILNAEPSHQSVGEIKTHNTHRAIRPLKLPPSPARTTGRRR